MNEENLEKLLSKPLTAVIVDDEAHGRRLVRRLAEHSGSINVTGEFESGAEFLRSAELVKPDVVFLDIQMPKMDGLLVAEKILNMDSLVVFVTAFEEHALEAFHVQAFDYILKPIGKQRFAAVAERLFQTVRGKRLEKLVARVGGGIPVQERQYKRTLPALDKIKVRVGDRIVYLDPYKVVWFEAANQYVEIHTAEESYLISSESLNSLYGNLDHESFLRIHRSAIINVREAIAIRVDRKGAYFVEMSNGDRVKVSRGNRGLLREIEISAK